MRALISIVLMLPGLVMAAEPVAVAWRVSPADDKMMIQCLQNAADKTPALTLNQHKADWFIDLAVHRTADDKQAWLAVSLSRIFDSKREMNAWMTGFDHPLPYAAMVDLGKITYGLVRPVSLRIEPISLPMDCAPLIEKLLETAAQRP